MSLTVKSTQKKSYDLIDPDQDRLIGDLYERDYAMANVPVGFGKTVCSLTAAQELLNDGELERVLVIAPLRVCQQAWADEPDDWEHLTVNVGVATGSASERLDVIRDCRYQIVVINFENLPWFCETFKKLHGFDGLIVDELTKLADVGATGFKRLRTLLPTFRWRVGLTATPVENGLEKLYAMCMVLDLGATFGRNKEQFLDAYFYPVDYERRRWLPKPDSPELLARMVQGFTFSIDPTTYEARLPELVQDTVIVAMPDNTRAAYKAMANELLVELEGQPVRAANNAVKQGKLQQLCSGFIYDSENDNDVIVLDNRRVETAYKAAKVNGPALIVYQYTEDLYRLQDMATADGAKFATLGAGVSHAKCRRAITDWNAGELDYLLVHPRSAGHGLNMQFGGQTIVFCGLLWSKDAVDQVIGRLRRRGSPYQTVRVVWVMVSHSVEDKVIRPRLEGRGEVAERFRAHLLDVKLEP